MVGNLDHKIQELDVLFGDCINNYQDPNRFLTYLHSLLPALRHFTLAIQSNKRTIPDFENWYVYWQNKLEADSVMSWLSQVRTKVVHEDIIAASSYAQIKFYEDYNEPFKVEVMNYMTSTDEMRARANELLKISPHLRFGNIEIMRSYKVTIANKDYEVVDVLQHGKRFMETIYRDLRNHLNNQRSKHLKPKGFVESHNHPYASLRFSISGGDIVEYTTTKAKLTKPFIDLVKKRYAGHPPLNFRERNDEKFIKELHAYAEFIFKTDGNHQPFLVTKSKGVWGHPDGVVFRDRAEKVLFWHELAKRVKVEDLEALAFIAEQWIHLDSKKYHEIYVSGGDTEEMPDKLECLATFYASKEGKIQYLRSMIIRDKSDSFKLGKPEITYPAPHDVGFLYPVFKSWGIKIKHGDK